MKRCSVEPVMIFDKWTQRITFKVDQCSFKVQGLAVDSKSGVMLWSMPLHSLIVIIIAVSLPSSPVFLLKYISLNYQTTRRHKLSTNSERSSSVFHLPAIFLLSHFGFDFWPLQKPVRHPSASHQKWCILTTHWALNLFHPLTYKSPTGTHY